MGQLTLLLAFHNHQPDGNFEHVFAQGFADCYGPLLQTLAEFPRVRVALHHTGALLEWIEKHKPDYVATLRRLVQNGQIEVMGGGFYEPMLAVLPERDAVGQIQMMNRWCQNKLGVTPVGMWLAERVWEPALASLIGGTGIKYTLTDDTHFRNAGWLGDLSGYYVTEKAGTPLAIFPIAKELRYAIPFKSPREAMQVLYDLGEAAGPHPIAVTYGDDGEKFGMWPGTKEWVWEKGWLREFFTLLSEAPPERVRLGHFQEVLRDTTPTGRVYLPTASYYEMGEWSLPADAQQHLVHAQHVLDETPKLKEEIGPFVRGGLWQNFLAKYPEANFMHKKMIRVSDKVAAAEAAVGLDDPRLGEARRELYRAQTNCGYWHGLFGGLYLNYIRHAVYTHLIGAEELADKALGVRAEATARALDLDADMRDELELTSDKLRVYVKPDEGGGVYQLDVRKQRMNLLNVMGRRREAYHDKLRRALEKPEGHGDGGGQKSIHDLVIVKDRTLGELLEYDRHLRLGFVDHFVPVGTRLEELSRGTYRELGDFAAGRYQVTDVGALDRVASVMMRRRGTVDGAAVDIEKRLRLEGGRLMCAYRLKLVDGRIDCKFGSEFAFTLLAGHDDKRRYREVPGTKPGVELGSKHLASHGELSPAPGLEALDEWLGLRVTMLVTPDARVTRFPLETASQSEGGFERTFQGSAMLPLWRVVLEPGQHFECRVTIEVGDLSMPDLRKDPIVNRWVIIATERAQRPNSYRVEPGTKDPPKGAAVCPFCPGQEDKTPREVLAYRADGSAANTPGWTLRVVPNKFPALRVEGNLDRAGEGVYDRMQGIGAHEVIIETPDHGKQLTGLGEAEIEPVFWAFRDRILDLRKDSRFKYIMIFKNHGRAAGASLEHPHSQLIALPVIPKTVLEEMEGARAYFQFKERCVFCDIVRQELSERRRVVYENASFVVIEPYAPKFPFETWILPKHHDSSFEDVRRSEYAELANAMRVTLRKLNLALDNPPYNFMLHNQPLHEPESASYHWHIEIMPSLSTVAGFEWGSGFYINPTSPEEAAAFLRDVKD